MLATIFLWLNFLTFDESNYKIKLYTVRDGIASNGIYSISRDNYGRYWIANNGGVQLFDGYNFRKSYQVSFIQDALFVYYHNHHLYVFSINQIQIIPIELSGKSNIYNFNFIDNIGSIYKNDTFISLYENYYELFIKGKKIKTIKILGPYYDYKLNRVIAFPANLQAMSYKLQISNTDKLVLSPLNHRVSYIANLNSDSIQLKVSIPLSSTYNISHLKDSIFYYKLIGKNATKFINYKESRILFDGHKVNQVREINHRVFFLTTTNGLIQYIERNYTKTNFCRWTYQRTDNSILKGGKWNLFNYYFKFLYGNNYLTEIQTDKILFSDSYVNYINWNQNIKSHYVLNDSLILLGYRKGQNTLLYNYKTRKIKKEYDPVWVKKVRAEDENNLFILTYDDFRIYKNGVKKVYQLKHKGNYVLTNDLLRSGSRYIYGTNDQGVFITDTNFKFQKHYHQGNGLQSNLIHQLKESEDGQLWLRSEKGIDRILKNGVVERIFQFDEIEDYDIKDFTASQDSLWVFTEKNVYALEYKTRLNPRKIPLVWHNLTVNDT